MMNNRVYLTAATQISLQEPLSEGWMEKPSSDGMCENAAIIDPDFREWISPVQRRRLGILLKRAVCTASKVMADSGIDNPDAIITGTGLGCLENTEALLNPLCGLSDTSFSPTSFMLSTHNTIGSTLAIHARCHGYNSTWSHGMLSFESALLDAFLQLRLGDIHTALVTGNDELTPAFHSVIERAGGCFQGIRVPAAGASVAMMLLGKESEGEVSGSDYLCSIDDVQLTCSPQLPWEVLPKVDAILIGANGNETNDAVYDKLLRPFSPDIPRLLYKHLFGEGFSASACGVYAGAQIVARGAVPPCMRGVNGREGGVKELLVVNHCEGKEFAFVLLKK